MAAVKKPAKKVSKMSAGQWDMSWKSFFIALSVTANVAFVVVVIAMMTSHALDGMFMNEGLTRYCAAQNDSKFADNSAKTIALRDYTCATGGAKQYFDDGFQKYLDAKGIKG